MKVFVKDEDRVLSDITSYILLGASILSIISSSFLAYTLFRIPNRFRVFSFQLIFVISLCGLMIGLLFSSTFVFRQFYSFPNFYSEPLFCSTLGVMILATFFTNNIMIGCLSLERYFLVCRNQKMNQKRAWLLLIIFFLFYVSNLVAGAIKELFIPDPTYNYCWIDGTSYAGFVSNLGDLGYLVPLLLLLFCYTSITLYLYGVNRNTSYNSGGHFDKAQTSTFSSKKFAIFKSMIFLMFYSLCFFPILISSIWLQIAAGEHKFKPIDAAGIAGLVTIVSINPILILSLHSQLNNEAMSLLFPKNQESNSEIMILH